MTKSVNSLDLDAYHATREAVGRDPEQGRGAFEAVTEWRDGALAETRARSFRIQTDEPESLGGGDTAIDPMELLLGAVGSCLTIGWVTHARKRGVELRDLRITVRAPFDLRGYLGVDSAVRPGFTALEYEVEVDAEVDDATLEAIRAAAEAGSPVVDNVCNATPLHGDVRRGG